MSDEKNLSRRDFIRSTATVGATIAVASMLGVTPAAGQGNVPQKWDKEADVVVAGSGPMGMAAAIEAADKGASVIMCEQMEHIGGSGVISGGMLGFGGGTKFQKANNIKATPDEYFNQLMDWQNRTTKRNDPKMTRTYANMSPEMPDWLEKHGVVFLKSGVGASFEGEPIGLAYKQTDGYTQGKGIMLPLEAYAKSKGVQILLQHKLTKIIREEGAAGRVLGVEVTTGGKKLYLKAKKAVVLGTGGWKGNRWMRKTYDSRMTDDLGATGEPFLISDGSGLIAALEVGAILQSDRGQDSAVYRRKFATKHYNYPLNSPYGGTGLAVATTQAMEFVFVNKAAKRYCNEDVPDATTAPVSWFDYSLKQEDHIVWMIFDDAAAKRQQWEVKVPVVEKDAAFSAPTLAELAKLINVPADALADTVKKYNSYVDGGKDPDFNKAAAMLKNKIETAPFYGVWVQMFVHDTNGGIVANEKTQVLDIYGKVIPGLYAGGETASAGLDLPGIPRSLVMGRVAAQNAVAEKPLA